MSRRSYRLRPLLCFLVLGLGGACRSEVRPAYAEAPASVSVWATSVAIHVEFDPVENAQDYRVFYAPDAGITPENYLALGGEAAVVTDTDVDIFSLDVADYWVIVVANYPIASSHPSPAVSTRTLADGGNTPPFPATAVGLTLGGTANAQDFGRSASNVGDVNGDGTEEFAVSDSQQDSGYLHVFSRNPSDPNGPAVRWDLSTSGGANHFGRASAALGDVNGDGFGDLAIGAPRQGTNDEGAVYIHMGSDQGPETVPITSFVSPAAGGEFGSSLAAARVVDMDATIDLLVGAPLAMVVEANQGFVEVIDGDSMPPHYGVPGAYTETLSGAGTRSGTVLALPVPGNAGDGYLLGSPGWMAGGNAGAGRVDHFRFTPGGQPTSAWSYQGAGPDASLGEIGTLGQGDFNCDQLPDIAVAAPRETVTLPQEGVVHIFYGRPPMGAFENAPDESFAGGQANANYGTWVAVGNVNGDCYDDLLVGAPQWDGAAGGGAGRADLYYGDSTAELFPVWTVSGTVGAQNLGASVALADFDDNGSDDLLVTSVGTNEAHTFYGPPPVSPRIRLQPVSSTVGTDVFPVVESFSSLGATPATCTIDAGDGQPTEELTPCDASALAAHALRYRKPGTYDLHVRVVDGFGLSGEAVTRAQIR